MMAFRTRKFYSNVLANQVDLTGRSSNVYVIAMAEDRTEVADMLSKAGLSYYAAVAVAEDAHESLTTAYIKDLRIVPID